MPMMWWLASLCTPWTGTEFISSRTIDAHARFGTGTFIKFSFSLWCVKLLRVLQTLLFANASDAAPVVHTVQSKFETLLCKFLVMLQFFIVYKCDKGCLFFYQNCISERVEVCLSTYEVDHQQENLFSIMYSVRSDCLNCQRISLRPGPGGTSPLTDEEVDSQISYPTPLTNTLSVGIVEM